MSSTKEINFDKRKFLSLEEIEIIYGIPVDTLRKWIRRDGSDGVPKLDAFKPGKQLLVSRETLELYIKRFPVTA